MADANKPRNNVYTVLVGAALIALIFGVVYIWMRNKELTGNANPFAAAGSMLDYTRAAVGSAVGL